MSENLKDSRPRRANANTHPAQVLLDAKQKRRTTAEKAADDEAKATKDMEEATKAQTNRQAVVARIAELEDAMQREDKAYPNIKGRRPRKPRLAKVSHLERASETDSSEAEDIVPNAKR